MTNIVDLALRLACAFAFGALIGFERQWRQRDAGLRTNALVAIGATLFVSLSDLGLNDTSPYRVAAQVVSGVGFLGGGVILKDGASVRGINTAATLWCSAAIGVLTGFGMLGPAALGTAAILLAHTALRPVASWTTQRTNGISGAEALYQLRIVCRSDEETHVRALLLQTASDLSLPLQGLSSTDLDDDSRAEVRAELVLPHRNDRLLEQIVRRLSLEGSVTAVRWKVAPAPEIAADI